MKNKTLLFFVVLTTFTFGQRQNGKSKSELGIFAGGSYYIGDLNSYKHFDNTNLAYGLIYRFNVHSRMAVRGTFTYGNLNASDAESSSAVNLNRNLSFQTDIYEFSSGVEFNYLPYQTGHATRRITPYLFAEIGVFRMNPKTNYNGNLIELQPLGTEGQGTELNSKKPYALAQLCFPIGMGLKCSLSKNFSFSLEYGFRKTFTDYIDDVGSTRYIDRTQLADINGPLVGELSNRSLDGSSYGRRGNAATQDWYFVCSGMLTYRLGPPDKCFNH